MAPLLLVFGISVGTANHLGGVGSEPQSRAVIARTIQPAPAAKPATREKPPMKPQRFVWETPDDLLSAVKKADETNPNRK